MRVFTPDRFPLSYLITEGKLTDGNFRDKSLSVLSSIELAASAGISMIQVREKAISAGRLFQLAQDVMAAASGSEAKVLINDRADIAAAVGADGVQLTENSLPASVVRKMFPDLIIGVSCHTIDAVRSAAESDADFAVFGPIFATPGKKQQGLEILSNVCSTVPEFPVMAIGGINESNFARVLDAGASGFAAIRSFNDPEKLISICKSLEARAWTR